MIVVGLYIKVPRVLNTIPFSADTMLQSADDMINSADMVSIAGSTYFYTRLDLFEDEKISLTSTIQDITDISKTKTDFSQSFTIPASKVNKKVFSYWQENKIDGYDARLKIDGYITLDGIKFRDGVIQLNKADYKNGMLNSYSLTFFGHLVSLKELFNSLYLKDLTLDNTYDFAYNGTEVENKVFTGNNSNIKFPLISSLRRWVTAGNGVDDISSNNTHPLVWNELIPALRLSSIFNMIQTQFGIEFSGNFLSNPRFTNAYLWLKNGEKFTPNYKTQQIPFSNFAYSYIPGRHISTWNNTTTYEFNYVNPAPTVTSGVPMNCSLIYTASVGPSSVGKKVWITAYRNGQFFSKIESTITGNAFVGNIYSAVLPFTVVNGSVGNSYSIPNGSYRIEISSDGDFTTFGTNQIKYESRTYSGSGSVWNLYEETIAGFSFYTYTSNLKVQSVMPEIKIEDFFSGIIKMFNLTIYLDQDGKYRLETLEDYYNLGGIVDITKYVDSDTISIERVKWYKKIEFLFQQSETYISSLFLSGNGRGYGDLNQDFDNTDSDFKIQLPFENILFTNLKNTLTVGYSLNSNLQPVKPKPVILYDYNTNNVITDDLNKFWFNNGTTTTEKNTYNCFGAEYINSTTLEQFSLNWGQETSVLDGRPISNSLYLNCYFNYLKNIFDKKARLIKIKSKLPLIIISKLKLYDRIKIGDKRYIINSFTTDLTTLEVTMELITDLRYL